MKKNLNRRHVLRGLGVTISLPLLDAMLPFLTEEAVAQAVGASRFVVLYKPNGYVPGSYTATNINNLTGVLASLANYRTDITIMQGMNNSAGEASSGGDGHASKISCFLTGGPITRSVTNIVAPKSIDHIIATARGGRPLTLSGPQTFNDSPNGFNMEYFNNVSWVGPRADARLRSPRAVFDLIFGAAPSTPTPTSATINKVYKKSILD